MTFRVTEEEYELLQKVCAFQGERCLSDLARAAMYRSYNLEVVNYPDSDLESRVRKLKELVHHMDLELANLSGHVLSDPPQLVK